MTPELPQRGVAAHRGGAATHPENTLAAFREAIRLGAQQIEFDVRAAADGEVLVLHDARVDRTTNGTGRLSKMVVAEARSLDAGSWKDGRFRDERIPTLREALELIPRDIWINIQIKRAEPVASAVAQLVVEQGRLHQALIACGNADAREARRVHPQILICNLARQLTREQYVDHAIATGANFLQFHHLRGVPQKDLVERARAAGLRVNHFCTAGARELEAVFEAGVDFPLVDDVARARAVAERLGIR